MFNAGTAPLVSEPESVRSRPGMRRLLMIGLAGVLAGTFLLSLVMGSVKIPLMDIMTILLGNEPVKASWQTIVLDFRLPKALTAMLAGAALAVSGLQMQTLFRNPLADPFILGISAGASLGVAVVVMSTGTLGLLAGLGLLGDLGLSAAAIGGAALVMGLVMVIGQRVQNNMTLLILGLMFGYTTAAVVNVLIYFSVPGQVQSFINWTFGSFGGVTWSQLQILAPIIGLGLIVAYLLVKPLNALLLGEIYARSMGLTVGRTRFWIIASASVLAGTVTAYCGPIAFLGVAIPHLCRSLFSTSDHRILLPSAMLMGALIALIADLVAEMPGSQALLPLNAITALIGAPIVVWIILHQRNLREAFAA